MECTHCEEAVAPIGAVFSTYVAEVLCLRRPIRENTDMARIRICACGRLRIVKKKEPAAAIANRGSLCIHIYASSFATPFRAPGSPP